MPTTPKKPGQSPKTDTRGRNLWLLLGFVLFIHGFVAVVLELVAVKVPYLLFLDAFGAGLGFFLKIAMTIGGLVMAFLARTDDSAYDEHFDGRDRRA
jgi:hypothetical protein